MSGDSAGMAPAAPKARTSRIECTLDNDPRLIVSIGAVLAHSARRAGLPESAQEEIATAAVEASREMLISANGNGSSASTIRLVVEEFSDRVEVTIESPAGARPEGIRKRLEGKFTDSLRYDERDGRVRLTLLKSCGAAKSGSRA
jgi:anti-sigma regulatory factor (Ser/Thr protein kinase)